MHGTPRPSGRWHRRGEFPLPRPNAGTLQPQPEIHLRADQAVPYRHVARTLADASRAGLTKVGFVSDPENP